MQKRYTDGEILALFSARDENAIAAADAAYGALCRKIAQNILGNAQDAEECVNDMLLAAWNSIPPEPEHLRAYLAALTRNLALNRLQRQNAQRRGGGELPLVLEELAEILPASETVETAVDSRALTDAIAAFLRGITPRARRVFLLRYFSAMPVSDVAKALMLNENTVKSILMRTREKLRVYLEKEGYL